MPQGSRRLRPTFRIDKSRLFAGMTARRFSTGLFRSGSADCVSRHAPGHPGELRCVACCPRLAARPTHEQQSDPDPPEDAFRHASRENVRCRSRPCVPMTMRSAPEDSTFSRRIVGFVAVRIDGSAKSIFEILLLLRGCRIDQRRTDGLREQTSAVLSRSRASARCRPQGSGHSENSCITTWAAFVA
jgi:hypothetical protein